jgi:hypothetical protein
MARLKRTTFEPTLAAEHPLLLPHVWPGIPEPGCLLTRGATIDPATLTCTRALYRPCHRVVSKVKDMALQLKLCLWVLTFLLISSRLVAIPIPFPTMGCEGHPRPLGGSDGGTCLAGENGGYQCVRKITPTPVGVTVLAASASTQETPFVADVRGAIVVVAPFPSPTPTPRTCRGQCVGDCNCDGRVTIDEIIKGVNIDLGNAEIGTCPAFRCGSSNLGIVINCVIEAVNNALAGCPVPSPTPTPTPVCPTPLPSRTCPLPDESYICAIDGSGCEVCDCCFEPLPGCCDFGPGRACFELEDSLTILECVTASGRPRGCPERVFCSPTTGLCESLPTATPTFGTPPSMTPTPTRLHCSDCTPTQLPTLTTTIPH